MDDYDFVVVGGGSAGLAAAVAAAEQGVRVLLVERDRTGGDCLWTGCVPSKALLSVAERAHTARTSGAYGVETGPVTVDFGHAMAHVSGAIAKIAPHDAPDRLRDAGVEVVAGAGRFVARDRLSIDGQVVRFARAMIATGASPMAPALPGLDGVAPLASDSVWQLEAAPERLVVLGGGPIGVELGQAFARLGSQVTIVEMAPSLLPREEPAAATVLEAALTDEGVRVVTGHRAVRVEGTGDDAQLVMACGDTEQRLAFDRLLLALGRVAATAELDLATAGVAVDDRGAVMVDPRLRTTNRRIYAGGDVTMQLPFTHTAAMHGATVVANAMFGLRRRVDHDKIPWVTFTDPEVARVGLTASQARDRFGHRAIVRTVQHDDLDRAVTAGATRGFATMVGDRRGRIVGATVVGPRAGETVGEVVAWMRHRARMDAITRSVHAYPTWNTDVAAASLAELRARLRRLTPVTRTLLRVRRGMWQLAAALSAGRVRLFAGAGRS